MPSAVRLREDYSAKELRALARRSKDVNQSRRLLSLAGAGRHGPRFGGEDRRHGPPDAARLGASLQPVGSGGPHRYWRDPPSIATQRIVPPMTFIDRARAFIGLADPVPKWPPDRLSLALQGGGSF